MSNKIFVGSLPFEFTDEQLEALFAAIGPVASAKMVEDNKNHRTRGFGFVAMRQDADMGKAIEQLNGMAIGDKKIWVTEARPKGNREKPPARPPAGRKSEGHFFDPLMNRRPPRPGEHRPRPSGFSAPRGERRPPRFDERRPRPSGFGAPSGERRPPRFDERRPKPSGFGAPSGERRPPRFDERRPRPSSGFGAPRGERGTGRPRTPGFGATGRSRPGGFGGGGRRPPSGGRRPSR